MGFVQIILILVLIYLALGALFVIPFLIKGLTKVDESTKGATLGFKIIIIPGVIIFWPFLLRKLRAENNAHSSELKK